jgi:hypothetical protein
VFGVSALSAAEPCTTGTLAEYIALGDDGCLGATGQRFFRFRHAQSGALYVPASSVTVTPTSSAHGTLFKFSSTLWEVGESQTYVLSYGFSAEGPLIMYLPGYHVGLTAAVLAAHQACVAAEILPCNIPHEPHHLNRGQACFAGYYDNSGSCSGTEIDVPNAQGLPPAVQGSQSSVLYTTTFTPNKGVKVYSVGIMAVSSSP